MNSEFLNSQKLHAEIVKFRYFSFDILLITNNLRKKKKKRRKKKEEEKEKLSPCSLMDVNFVTSAGTTFTIEIGYFDTVLEIKEKIEKYKGYPITSQKLIFNGQYLIDDRDTVHYEILQGSTIQLAIANTGLGHQRTPPPASSSPATRARQKLKLSVESMNMIIHAEMEEHSKVGLLRDDMRRAYAMINLTVPDKYFFVHNKEVMDEDSSFHQHNVKDGDIIKVFEGKVTRGHP